MEKAAAVWRKYINDNMFIANTHTILKIDIAKAITK